MQLGPLWRKARRRSRRRWQYRRALTPGGRLWAEHGGVRTWGDIEAGFRGFIDRPPTYSLPGIWPSGRPTAAGTTSADPPPLVGSSPSPIFPTDRESRAKFEEYGDINSGFFFEKLVLGAQTKDGDYETELRADNAGNNNQRYIWDWSKSGEYYSTLSWDQIPHLYSTSAYSIWDNSTVGTNFLTTPVSIPGLANPANAAQRLTAIQLMYDQLNGHLNIIDIGIRRDKFSTTQRWTPDQNWDVRAEYSHEHREGTQVGGAVIAGMGTQQMVELPVPIDDVTQNAKLSGQYYGDTPWGGKFNVRTSAGISSYANDFDSYIFQNPFGNGTATYPNFGRVSLPPDNQAYNFAATAGVDLPNKSRYMGTVSYTMMRQDDPFIPFTINPVSAALVGALPASSADAKVNTLLVNNVLNTQLSKDVKSTLRYRYYDNSNDTPELLFPNFVVEDIGTAAGNARRNLAYAYTKQNASEELVWRADRNLTIGGSVGWEQYDRDRRSVNVTNEYIGKVFLDARFNEETRLRSSYQYSERSFNNYDFMSIASYIYYNPANPSQPLPAGVGVTNMMMRQFDLADRDRQKANVSLEWTGIKNLTITPTAGLRFDDYDTNPNESDPRYTVNNVVNATTGTFPAIPGQLGMTKDYNWNAGVEVAYAFSPGTTLMFAYVHENFDRDLYGGQCTTNFATLVSSCPGGGAPPPRYFFSNMDENVDTYIVTANIELVPDTLDLKVSYSYAHGTEDWTAQPYTNSSDCLATVNSACQPFPTVKTDFQRLDAVLKYKVDPNVVTKLGFEGDVVVKLRYAWEHVDVKNWQNDLTTPYMYLVDGSMVRNISMAAYNPNYDAHLIAASLAIKW
ncbi:MAG: MtrB/PioB family decaheme-associated outer membrane protein [Blastochloris sp.]|nr:MtrB/PioB family decaheme-associated outer membrane protein [Blastochloris sp.]